MFEHKVVMVTGASKGLGRALALKFAEEGAKLAICARNHGPLMEVEKELRALGAEVVALEADVSNARDVDRFVSVTEETLGGVDVLFNNASVFGPGPRLLADYPEEEFLRVLTINTLNPFLVTKRVLPGMIGRGMGSIINLTSEAGETGFAEWGAYGISKFAVEGLTQTWSDELGDTGIRVNMVDPGEMDTDMHDQAVPHCDYPLAAPGDHLDVFLYLASDASLNENGKRFAAREFQWDRGGDHE
ncbi:3-oxoacyl-ACP reductase [Bacillus sp. AFS015802]|uniref:SDR family NAD(P)-dependent oxidoreductase n=1 Tax=Bacillus sp. AFS015802 TaxID=2033486 RepID=UPI000BFA18DA|nr:SDR family oxidoreductase [Bacillus sp. AFS015802]PFA68104.1 3-oxoacyl-ACP reductase [Bacillus sp. AFS015802]